MDIREHIYKLLTVSLIRSVLLLVSILFFIRICVVLMLVDDILDFVISLRDQNIVFVILSPFRQAKDLPLQRIDGQSLSRGDFQHPLDVHDDLVELRVVLLKLLESLLLINLENLLFDPQPLPLVLSPLLDHVVVDHVLQRRFGLQRSDLGQPPDANVLKSVFKPPCFLLLLKGQILRD